MRTTAFLVALAALLSGPVHGAEPVKQPVQVVLTDDTAATLVAEGVGKTREAAVRDAVEGGFPALLKRLGDTTKTVGLKDDSPLPMRKLYTALGDGANVLVLSGKADDEVRVRVTARVPVKDLADHFRKQANPMPKEIDGQKLAAQIAAKAERAKEADAWTAAVLKDYPYGCVKIEIAEWAEVAKRRTADSALFEVKLRYTLDPARYTEFTEWLVRALADLSGTKPEPFTLSYVALSGRQTGNYGLSLPPRNVLPYSEFIQPTKEATRESCAVAVGERAAGAGSLTISGRQVVVSEASAASFHRNLTTASVRGKLQFLGADDKVIVSRGVGDSNVGLGSQQQLVYRDEKGRMLNGSSNLFVYLPTVRRHFYSPASEETVEVRVTLDYLKLITQKPRVVPDK